MRLHPRQAGVALAILLWFLAAMALLVGSIVNQAKTDSRLTQLHLGRAKAQAAADGAIQLVLAQRMREQQNAALGQGPRSTMAQQMRRRQQQQERAPGEGMYFGTAQVGGLTVSVVLTPLSGLVDLNSAPEELLARLFAGAAGVEEEQARRLALAAVTRRGGGVMPGDPGGEQAGAAAAAGGQRYETVEDLMRVEGLDRHIFEAVQDAIYVADEGSAGVDWQAAPAEVLQALGAGDADAAREIVSSRMRGPAEQVSLPPELDLSFQQPAATGQFRVDAMVEVQGFGFVRRRWVDTRRGGPDGLPWNFFRTERLRGTDEGEKAIVKTFRETDAAL